jgi:leucine dehydrogenase
VIFDAHDFDDHEQVTFCYDKASGLKAIIAIHNTNLGPALGGCRFWPYATEEDALKDVLRLSRGMTYKAALANLELGGGKAVIIGDSHTEKTPEKLRAFGRFVERLNGLYITAEDMGTSLQDMSTIFETTTHVVGREAKEGGSGDPSILTSFGVFTGIQSCVYYKLGKEDLTGVRIAIQGLGHVGIDLVKRLSEAGATLVLTDINKTLLQKIAAQYGAEAVGINDIYSADVDVFAPCALGGILNDRTIPLLKCKIVAGSANNQLAEPHHAKALEDRNILYAPDYLINSGGLINVSYEGPNYNLANVMTHVGGIYHTLLEIFETAKAHHMTTSDASDHLAKERFSKRNLVNKIVTLYK